jgi:hypothetical protein
MKGPLPAWAAWAACAAGLLAAACTRNDRVAGATSETTNGDLQAIVKRADGVPAARVRVLLVDDEDWLGKAAEGQSVILDSAVTDAKGAFRMRVPLAHRCNLQIDGADGGVFLRGINTDLGISTAGRTFGLAAYGSISGKVRSEAGSARELRLAGTAYAAAVGADCAY